MVETIDDIVVEAYNTLECERHNLARELCEAQHKLSQNLAATTKTVWEPPKAAAHPWDVDVGASSKNPLGKTANQLVGELEAHKQELLARNVALEIRAREAEKLITNFRAPATDQEVREFRNWVMIRDGLNSFVTNRLGEPA